MPWVASVNARGNRPLGRLRLRIVGDVLDLFFASLCIPGLVATLLRLADVEKWQEPLRFGWIVVLIYTVVPVALTGATLGKRLVGQRVERYTVAAVPGLTTSLIRYVVATGLPIGIVGGLIPALAGAAALLSIAWLLLIVISIVADTERRGLHDKVAGTVVVRR